MKKTLFGAFFCLGVQLVFGQSNGDYQSRAGGNWNQTSVWEVFFNGAWQPLNTSGAGPFQNIIPTSASGVITTRHLIAVTASVNVNQLTIESGSRLTVGAGIIFRLVDDLANTPLTIDLGGYIINNGTVDFTLLTATPAQINGILASSASVLSNNASLVRFNNGSLYQHSNKTGGNIPLATWALNSTCHIFGLTSPTATAVGNLTQPFGNFLWFTPSLGPAMFTLNGQLTTVNGNLIIADTGGKEVRLDNGGPGTTTIVGGDLIMQAGNFTFFGNQSSTATMRILGDFIMSGGNLNLAFSNGQPVNVLLEGDFVKTGGTITHGSGTGEGTLRFDGGSQSFQSNGSILGRVNYSVETGSNLDLGTSALTGTGTFRLNAGATIQVKSLDTNGAIQTGAAAGNIQVSGIRTYVTGSTIVYNGLGTQFMSSGHPPAPNTSISNNDTVYMLSNVTINGALTLQSGSIVIDANTLTLGGTVSYPAGFLGITTASNVVINGSGNFGSLVLAPVQFAQNPMNNLTINRAGTVTLGQELVVAGTFRQTAGTFILDGNSGSALTLRGPVVQTGGNIGTTIEPRIVIEGAGVLPANLSFAPGAALDFLIMNRPGATFSTSSPLTITNTLNLQSGTVNHPLSNITMGSNSLVLRSGGAINQLLGAVAMYNVVYQPTAPITTGNELPTAANRLQNLHKQGPATVTLDRDLVVNGEMFLEQGIFDAGVGNDLTLLDNLIANGGTFEPQQGLVTFAATFPQTISGTTSPLSFYNLSVAQTVPTSLSLLTAVEIENRLSVTSASTLNAGNQLLTLLSTATSTAFVSQLGAGASIEGAVIAQRYLPNAAGIRTWRYITPVVTGSFVSDWKTELSITGTFSDPVTGPGIISTSPSMYIWNEAFVAGGTDRYQRYPVSGLSSAAPLQNGRGYSVFGRTDADISFDSRGRLGQGPTPVAVTTSGGTEPGWNLIGNPYPAPIDWDLVAVSLPGVVDNAVYITDNANNGGSGGNVTYIDGVSVPASFQGIIAPGQGFFVHTNGNATITFQESHKFAGQGQFFREVPPTDLLRISVKTVNNTDEIALRMRDEATDLFDVRFDARKLPVGDLMLSTLSADNQKLSINAISSMACGKTIPLVIETAIAGSYSLNFAGIESFTQSTPLYLKDKITEQLIDLSKSEQYAFTVADGSTLKDRFTIVIGGPTVETTLEIAGATVCESETTARVSLARSQKDVVYSVVWNGQTVSSEVVGTGSSIELPVTVASLPQGVQEVNVLAHYASCGPEKLTNTAVLKIVKTEKVESVEHGSICEPGTLTLKAHGAEGLKFNWYEGLSDVRPVFTSAGEFVTPSLTKSKTYFVAALNEVGCEGERVPVEANIVYVDPVIIEQEGSMLISSYDEGNKWFLDGVELENGTGKEIEALASGNYSVQVTCKGCKTTASAEIQIIGEEKSGVSVVVFPNPTPGKVNVEVKSKNGEPLVRVINSQGQELASVKLKGESDRYFGEFDLMSYPNGVYMIQVRDGQKQFIKKISKIE